MPALVYDRRYNLGFPGLQRLHPFDVRKYGRAWQQLRKCLGASLRGSHVPVDRPATKDELLLAHSADYLARIKQPAAIATAIELPAASRVPAWALRRWLLRPMRWAARGTILAAQHALEQGLAFNLGGGFHHAKSSVGEGFCLFADVAIAIRQLRRDARLAPGQRVAYVDLDAHQGNGVCHQFMNDRDVFIFDMYNRSIYPAYDEAARARIYCDVPLRSQCRGGEYLDGLRARLPGFIDSVARSGAGPLGVYNAGTDVVEGDPLGDLALTPAEVLERDIFVVDEFRNRGFPLVIVISGGYTSTSWQLIAATAEQLIRTRA
jgi:histone deacetylase 11